MDAKPDEILERKIYANTICQTDQGEALHDKDISNFSSEEMLDFLQKGKIV